MKPDIDVMEHLGKGTDGLLSGLKEELTSVVSDKLSQNNVIIKKQNIKKESCIYAKLEDYDPKRIYHKMFGSNP